MKTKQLMKVIAPPAPPTARPVRRVRGRSLRKKNCAFRHLMAVSEKLGDRKAEDEREREVSGTGRLAGSQKLGGRGEMGRGRDVREARV
ncbi:hypothetical protein DPEC_G00349920 [Dallia pectoralis]|uniref:Uncharacterized protein n=1 Tax=Dallia pectoralis TaxID=75939 RepID=A0ACC2F1K2_DALPE|nr:hypothetical protein DPEC_G00349920 [Dallia pectoralis]